MFELIVDDFVDVMVMILVVDMVFVVFELVLVEDVVDIDVIF